MTVRVGDAVFIRSGIPAVVKDRNEGTGQLRLETDLPAVQKEMRHGYLNGLTPETRQQLYAILDEVKSKSEAPEARIDELRSKLTELELDPKQQMLARYVRAEMVHLMNTYEIRPKEYSYNESKAR